MKIKYERELRGEELYELYDAMIFFHGILHPAVLMYDFHIIHNVIIILSRAGFITNQFNDLLPERCTIITKVKGSNPVQA